MKIDLETIKRLRELTGVGITDAKKALVDTDGDFDKALEAMRKKGLTKADKRGEREARSGVIGSYVHDSRIGVLVEINCETDFVARNEKFTDLVKDVSMHIAASSPEFISQENIPKEVVSSLKKEFEEKVAKEGKPTKMIPQIVEGMLSKALAERCLLEQPFIKNQEVTVGDHIKSNIAILGENIVVKRFSRMALGEVL
jgi:elongation factor Ts